ncbi:hypothetical protein [Nocardia arizonensis]|uniref:hypothetical protein n=1 Tax=Nocardia arizonensis TaxID=1141647 RepID=UPI0006D23440|nr:hypothetical protein [Nocardia arizonensis]
MMFESCHSVSEVAALYQRLGFSQVSCTFNRVSLVTSPALGAVVMPEVSGRSIRDRLLKRRQVHPVPVLSYARRGRDWVFLVGPQWGGAYGTTTLASLAARGLRVLSAGERIWLPMSDNRLAWYWITEPENARLVPSRTTVISAFRDHLEQTRSQSAGV